MSKGRSGTTVGEGTRGSVPSPTLETYWNSQLERWIVRQSKSFNAPRHVLPKEPAETWRDRASCVGNPEWFYSTGRAAGRALQVCAACPVVKDCLASVEGLVAAGFPFRGVQGGKVWYTTGIRTRSV